MLLACVPALNGATTQFSRACGKSLSALVPTDPTSSTSSAGPLDAAAALNPAGKELAEEALGEEEEELDEALEEALALPLVLAVTVVTALAAVLRLEELAVTLSLPL